MVDSESAVAIVEELLGLLVRAAYDECAPYSDLATFNIGLPCANHFRNV